MAEITRKKRFVNFNDQDNKAFLNVKTVQDDPVFRMMGGNDDVTVYGWNASLRVSVYGAEGNDELKIAEGARVNDAYLSGGNGDDYIWVGPNVIGQITLDGGEGRDKIYGGDGGEFIQPDFATNASDTIYGGGVLTRFLIKWVMT
jgi:Ca2+-binding RTX toxin-like protein